MRKQPAAKPAAEAKPLPTSTNLLLRLHAMIDDADEDELRFFEAFLDEHDKGVFTIIECAFAESARAVGYGTLTSEIDNGFRMKEELRGLCTLALDDRNEWLRHFVSLLLTYYADKVREQFADGKTETPAFTPEKVLFMWDSAASEFKAAAETTRTMLRRYPEMFGGSSA